jgi:hypothetical protein
MQVSDGRSQAESGWNMLTLLRAGRFGIRVPAEARDFSLLQNGHTSPVAHPASYSIPWVLSRGSDGRGVKLTTEFHVVPRFGISGAIPLLPYIPSRHTEGQLYLSWLRACLTSGLCLIVFTGDSSSLT